MNLITALSNLNRCRYAARTAGSRLGPSAATSGSATIDKRRAATSCISSAACSRSGSPHTCSHEQPPSATTVRSADNGLTSASGAAHSVQAQPAELPTPSLQALKQRAHQLLESKRSLQQQNQALAAERLGFESERVQQATQHQELSVERDALQAERDSLTAQLQELTAERESIQQQWETLQTTVEDLQDQLIAQGAQTVEQSEQRVALEARVEELQGQLYAQRAKMTEQATLNAQLQEITVQRDFLQQERDAFTAEHNQLTAKNLQLVEKHSKIQSERDTLRQLLEELFPYEYIRKRNNIAEEVTNREIVELCLQPKERQHLLCLGFQKDLAHAICVKAAFLQIFPYERYRELRSSFYSLEDLELANHYIEHGMHEGLAIEPEML